MYYGIFPTPDLHVFISLWCNCSDERIQYFITHAMFTLLVQCMEFTLSYYDVTFYTTWCTKTCHLMLLFLTDTCSSHSNDSIVLESRKSYWVDYLRNQLFFFFFTILCTCLLTFELVFIKITGKWMGNLVHK